MIDLVVLAAGRGKRLGALGDDTPKWLLEVGGATIAERQLEGVARAEAASPATIGSVRVVVGHAAPAIERFAAGRALELVANPTYEELNNWYSLLLALQEAPADPDRRIVVVNADLLASPDWFAKFIFDCAVTEEEEALIAVDTARPLTDESMKVALGEGEDGGLPVLGRIGKAGVDEAVGEYVGMFGVRGAARRDLEATLGTYVDSDAAANHWYEHAIGETARHGTRWVVWPTPDSHWIEIDDEADHALATAMGGFG